MPVFPDDILDDIRKLKADMKRLFTSANTKPAFNKVEQGPLVAGRSGSRTITLNPDGTSNPEIHMDPDGTGANVTRIVADTDGAYSGEAVLHLLSGNSASGDSELKMASGEVFMRVRDSGGDSAGGYAYWGRDEAIFGYRGASDNYFRFGQNICRHTGQWDDYGASLGSDAGIVPGSVSTSGAASFYSVSYPSTMASNMGPVCTVRRSSANFRWCITASSSSGFTIRLDNSDESFAFYFWAFRH